MLDIRHRALEEDQILSLYYGVSRDCINSKLVSSVGKEYAGVLRWNIRMGLFIMLYMRPGKGRFNSSLLKENLN